MRHVWLFAATVACGGGTSDKPAVQPDPVPAPPPVSAPAPREPQAAVAKDTAPPAAPPRTKVKVVVDDEAYAMADLLTAEGPSGVSEGDMSKRRPGADLGSQIADVRDSGKSVAIGGGGATTSGSKIDGPSTSSTTAVPAGPTGRISVTSKMAADESTLTPDAVLMKIQSAYMAGIKRCYKDVLKRDVTARGKMVLRFTVNQTGRATSPSAKSFSTELDTCVTSLMGSWRFPIPKDKDGEPTDASFSIVLNLVPD